MNIPVKGIVTGGLIGGALDLAFAVSYAAMEDFPPVKLLQTIASGAFGSSAFDGGAPMAAAGFTIHFLLSILWAAVFALLASRVAVLRKHLLVSGAAFGILVFFAMRCVLLPLSVYPRPVSFSMPGSFYDLLSHMFLFGVPIALAYRRYAPRDTLEYQSDVG
jgi:uncharacterized membrane protein YagU involved in acid resistance